MKEIVIRLTPSQISDLKRQLVRREKIEIIKRKKSRDVLEQRTKAKKAWQAMTKEEREAIRYLRRSLETIPIAPKHEGHKRKQLKS